ncbi:hypothetical protein JAO76_14150 [Pontibacter sp. BT310]|uniref:Uncharacterized protein n=1 Tax=Pontibacter populi TaxID=890055 RepID=A0ABS6XDY0_9BACT|nr:MULTISPECIES: hypothetical protein [Pontibacter]MBJ6119348.1 hypothetical protein [Pontibacter sp. BT310]MBR0571776.1 hypothetical protein [Microvirga sp. STS03]MBW3366202.1 hypothetical protein [Pontibacter populi]
MPRKPAGELPAGFLGNYSLWLVRAGDLGLLSGVYKHALIGAFEGSKYSISDQV